ncbi:hypothetical protein GHT06_020559 [Daphnia sinensis]|uniref:Uncharacterized protein n=1 Tax=Daphnia sinensis TaxID=1820382 RepID=A0AAD5KJ84_9CRUS|nr:hypothetical protein GHT06_020559 [Daphnia sinensis]
MEELYAGLVYRDVLDFEIVPANQVPLSLLEYNFVFQPTQMELWKMTLNVLVDEIECVSFIPQPHRKRKRG